MIIITFAIGIARFFDAPKNIIFDTIYLLSQGLAYHVRFALIMTGIFYIIYKVERRIRLDHQNGKKAMPENLFFKNEIIFAFIFFASLWLLWCIAFKHPYGVFYWRTKIRPSENCQINSAEAAGLWDEMKERRDIEVVTGKSGSGKTFFFDDLASQNSNIMVFRCAKSRACYSEFRSKIFAHHSSFEEVF